MTIYLQADDQDLMSGKFPRLREKIFEDKTGAGVHTEFGIEFGSDEVSVTLWFRTEGERQMIMQTAEILTQR